MSDGGQWPPCVGCSQPSQCGNVIPSASGGNARMLCWTCSRLPRAPLFVVSFATFGVAAGPPPAPAHQIADWEIVHTGEPRHSSQLKAAGVDIVWRCQVVEMPAPLP